MGTHPVQGGGRDPPLRGSKQRPCLGEEYVRPGRRPPPFRASDGLATCWAYQSQGGCSLNCDHKWDHCPSAAEDIGPRQEYAGRIRVKL